MLEQKNLEMKRVRMLLRVSSDAQLDADGDLNVQRQLVMDYVNQHPDWELDQDKPEYFEGSNSGYKNAVADRNILQEALKDAENKKYDILVAYKDDRIGRRLWEIGSYIMTLKNFGVDIYTKEDGCISPSNDDLMGQMVLALRYGTAQKSSSDTGIRVKDTAKKLVAQGKFMGGTAPYGYAFKITNELSKHGRLQKKLVICPEKAEAVRYIYDLSLNMEFGSAKIARILNENEPYKNLAPKDIWKSETITNILKNPIYSGRTAYNRHERINNVYRTVDRKDWIIAEKANEEIRIIDDAIWNRVQEKRTLRASKYTKKPKDQNITVISRNDGMLPLVDIAHCGYCGCKMTNGSKYNYWKIKSTGEKRTSKIPIYRCQNAHQGMPHDKTTQYRADKIDPIVFNALSDYIDKLQENEDIFQLINNKQNGEKKIKESELTKLEKQLEKIDKEIAEMNKKIPSAITGDYALSIEKLMSVIEDHEKRRQEQYDKINQIKEQIEHSSVSIKEWEEIYQKLPTWKDVFLNANVSRKRVLVSKLIERIDIKKDNINIRFKLNLNEFLQSRMSVDGVTTPYTHDLA